MEANIIAEEKPVAEMTLTDLRTMIRWEIRQQVETRELHGGLLAHNHSKRSYKEVWSQSSKIAFQMQERHLLLKPYVKFKDSR